MGNNTGKSKMKPIENLVPIEKSASVEKSESIEKSEPIGKLESISNISIPKVEHVSNKLSHNMKKMYEENKGDIIIKSKTREFRVHSLLLSLNSSLFKSMFSHEMEEKKSKIINYENYDDETIDLFLRYLYYQGDIFSDSTISLDEFQKKSPLLELFDMHFLEDAMDNMRKQMNLIIESTIDIQDLCKILIYLKSKYVLETCYLNGLKKFIVEMQKISELKKYQSFSCYDSIPPGIGNKPISHKHRFCCKHLADINLDKINPFLADATPFVRCKESKKYYCIAFTMERSNVTQIAESKYCCEHRSIEPKEMVEFKKKITCNINLPETIKHDLINEMIKKLNESE